MAEAPRRVGRCLLAGRERRRSLWKEKKKDSFDFSSKKFLLRETNIFFKPNLSLVARHSSLLATTYPTMMMTTFHPQQQSLFSLGWEKAVWQLSHVSPLRNLLGFLSLLIHISPCPVPKFLCNLNCKRNRKKKKKKQAVGENCVACAIAQFLQAYPRCVRIKSKC